MEDLRDAEQTVASFATLIERLHPDKNEATTKRQDSSSSRLSASSSRGSKGSRGPLTPRWRPKTPLKSKKESWDESVEGMLWNELEKPQSEVAARFQVDATALKEYISSPEMMELGAEFARAYHRAGAGATAKAYTYWVAEDLFFELQAVKQGDQEPARWTRARSSRRHHGWDLADHLVRFVLMAEQTRLSSPQDKWQQWEWSFAGKVAFYISLLRCYTVRDAKQRQLSQHQAAHSRQSSQSSSQHSRKDRVSPT
ncbi:hypothetical protein F4780DRAFT_783839 [Xylariomycetidae sp. FL0641]|nr:hypothetical protein F4780DRAFT_783839 [Xylariomycetidae sp. FL0641]